MSTCVVLARVCICVCGVEGAAIPMLLSALQGPAGWVDGCTSAKISQ